MATKLTNNAVSRLASGILAGATSLSVNPGTGALFPTISGSDTFPATLIRGSDGAVEIVKVTARATDVFTIARAQESTAALAFVAGDRIECRLTAKTFTDQATEVATHAATSKATPVDTDELPLVDSEASNVLNKLTWANLKATLLSYFGGLFLKLDGTTVMTGDLQIGTGKGIIFEGATADAFETTVVSADPTADRTITFPDKTMTVAGTDAAQKFTAVQTTEETTDNDGSFDLSAALDFICTPTGAFTLTFTNIPATPIVQKGTIILVNPSGYAVSAHANTKVGATFLATVSAAGTYEIAYRTSNGVAYVTASGAMS